MPRFYCDLPLTPGTILDLPEGVAHHIQVLRLQAGDTIQLFNGDGHDYVAEVAEVHKRRATVQVHSSQAHDAELPFAVQLAQALPEGSKMDWIIEKAVELGVGSIQPLAARRSVVRLSGERAEKKRAHWQGVISAATEQCGRTRLATLEPLREFGEWVGAANLDQGRPAQRILLSPRATQPLGQWAREAWPQPVCLLIGPEGGLAPEEEAQAVAHGALALSMGPRILRTETAGLAALAVLAAAWGGLD